MLNSLRIENYRCFHRLEVPLKPLTVVVGANDTGKSTFLRAIRCLSGELPWDPADFHRGSAGSAMVLSAETLRGRFSLRWNPRENPNEDNPQLRNEFSPVGFYQLPVRGVELISGGLSEGASAPQLLETGTGVPTLLDYFLRRDRVRFDSIESAMRDLIPGFERIEIVTPEPAQRRIDLTIDNGFRIHGDRSSAGVRLLIFFVALAYHPNPPRLILLEEPETGIHPRRLVDVVRLLREITQGKHGGHKVQIVLTTHSPYLLDLIDPGQDQVLVFRRDDDGTRTAEPADAERLRDFLEEFMLGEVWYNQGEEGLIARKA